VRVLIYAFGTQGDIQPYIALAQGLDGAGHQAAVCTSEGFRAQVEAHGVSYAYMNNDLLQLVQDAMPQMRGGRDALKMFSKMSAAMRSSLQDQWAAAQTETPDLIVYHPKTLGGYHIAERLKIPGVLSLPLPFFTPTREFPIPFIGHWPLGGWANRASYQFQRFTAVVYGGMINDFRRHTLHLRPVSRLDSFLHQPDGRPVPILYPFSRHVRPVPADYPAHAHVTGYWFLDHPDDWQPAAELVKFLEDGEPPVYVGFGSMGFGSGSDERHHAILTAVRRTGIRAIIATGWGVTRSNTDAAGDVLVIKGAPHDWLFPQTAAVVHHGGAGTTGAALRAGRPTLICPFVGDQPFWGHQVHQLGAGPEPLPQRRLNADRLTERLVRLRSTTSYQDAAASLAQLIRAEDGVGRAIEVLEDIGRR
jgi:sterol 3beta-glucosyltransferase